MVFVKSGWTGGDAKETEHKVPDRRHISAQSPLQLEHQVIAFGASCCQQAANCNIT